MIILSWILIAGSSAGIAYQDFKTRWISLWLIISFSAINISQYLFFNSIDQFIENTIFCLCYFLFSFLILVLFYYLKSRKLENIIDKKIGWADVILFISIGCTLEPTVLIYFFTACFILSLLIQMTFLKKDRQVPLAGILSLLYLIYLFTEKQIS